MTEPLARGGPGSEDLPLSTAESEIDAPDETVLLPVGPSDDDRLRTLADAAAEVAGMMQTTVRVLHVFGPPRFDRELERLGYDPGDDPDPDAVAKRVDQVQAVSELLATPLRNWGTTMTVEGRVGDDVSAEIVAAARETDAKRILVGGRRRSPTGKVVYGSTAQEVLLDSPCPVTFLRDGPPDR